MRVRGGRTGKSAPARRRSNDHLRCAFPAAALDGRRPATLSFRHADETARLCGIRVNLAPAGCVTWLPMLMAYYQDSNAAFQISIYERVRENLQREGSSSSRHRRTQAGVFNQKLGNTFEFFEKASGDHRSGLFAVKIHGVGNVMLRLGVERPSHRESLARSRAMASCPGTAAIKPESRLASLRSASRSQASSTSGSASRLAISRSSRCERSTGASRRTSASRTSRFVFTLTSVAIDA